MLCPEPCQGMIPPSTATGQLVHADASRRLNQDVLDDGVTLPVEMLSYPSVIIGTEAWNVDHGEAVELGRPRPLAVGDEPPPAHWRVLDKPSIRCGRRPALSMLSLSISFYLE